MFYALSKALNRVWDVLSGVEEMAWDVLSGAAKMVWYLIVSIPDLCTLTYFYFTYMGCFVRGDKNGMGYFVRGGKSMRDVLSGESKNGIGCFVLKSI